MAGIIDARAAIKAFVELGEAMETERSEEAIESVFCQLLKLDQGRFQEMTTEDAIALATYYRTFGEFMEERLMRNIEKLKGKKKEYHLWVIEILKAFAAKCMEGLGACADEQGG